MPAILRDLLLARDEWTSTGQRLILVCILDINHCESRARICAHRLRQQRRRREAAKKSIALHSLKATNDFCILFLFPFSRHRLFAFPDKSCVMVDWAMYANAFIILMAILEPGHKKHQLQISLFFRRVDISLSPKRLSFVIFIWQSRESLKPGLMNFLTYIYMESC